MSWKADRMALGPLARDMGNALLAMVKSAFFFSDEHVDTSKASDSLLLRIIERDLAIKHLNGMQIC